MSYNGVGLSTPRGSGTNGHITRNLSTVRHHDTFKKPAGFSEGERRRAPDAGILEHDRKRRVEVKCLELEVGLQDDGVGEEEVERQVSALRQRLLAESAAGNGSRDSGSIKMHETHELSRANDFANERMRKAMGIRTEDYVEGRAFDREALAADKVKKAEQRELDNIERARIQAQLKIDREKANVERDAARAREDIERQKRKVEDAQRAKTDAEDREQSRARRVQDDMRQLDSELDQGQAPRRGSRSRSPLPHASRDAPPHAQTRRRSRSPPAVNRKQRSLTPPMRRRLPSRSRSRSRSPAPRINNNNRRGRSPTRSISRSASSRSRSRSYSRSVSRSRSPPRRRARRDSPSRSRSRSRSPRRRSPGPSGARDAPQRDAGLSIKGRASSP